MTYHSRRSRTRIDPFLTLGYRGGLIFLLSSTTVSSINGSPSCGLISTPVFCVPSQSSVMPFSGPQSHKHTFWVMAKGWLGCSNRMSE